MAGNLLNLQYSYDNAGNITQLIDGAQTATFLYDHLDRLASASATGGNTPTVA